MDFPVDRLISPPWPDHSQPINTINYNTFGNNARVAMIISGIIAKLVSDCSAQSVVHTYLFNKVSFNNWANNDFVTLVTNSLNAVIQVPDTNQWPNIIDNVIQNTAAYYFAQNINEFQSLMYNNPALFQSFVNRAAQAGFIQNNQAYSPQMYNQPQSAVPYNPLFQNQPTMAQGKDNNNTTYTPTQTSSVDPVAQLKDQAKKENSMNRSEHEGVPVAQFVTPDKGPVVQSAGPVKTEQTESIFLKTKQRVDNSSQESIVANYEKYDDCEGYSSFKNVSDTIYTKYESFLSKDLSAFPYVYCSNLSYLNPIPPFSGRANLLMVVDMFRKFLDFEISADEIIKFRSGIHEKFSFILNVLYIQLSLRLNYILSTFKTQLHLDPHEDNFFMDYALLKNYLHSIKREDIYLQIKESMPRILDDFIKIINEKGVSHFSSRIPLVLVYLEKKDLLDMEVNSLGFMKEHDEEVILIITTDNHLFLLEIDTKYNPKEGSYVKRFPNRLSLVGALI